MSTGEETVTKLAMACATAIVAGLPTVTISATGKKPTGFPRGELLSVGTSGSRNYALDPVKVLAWIHRAAMSKRAAEAGEREGRHDPA